MTDIERLNHLRAEGHTCWNVFSGKSCAKCVEEYEAKIVAIPPSYGAALGELLGLLAEPHACGTFWPYGTRRQQFLAEWIGANVPAALAAPTKN